MADTGKTIALIKALAKVDPADIQESVEDWLDDHPEATTTVQDGSITKAKLDNNLQSTVDDVSDLKSALNDVAQLVEQITALVQQIVEEGTGGGDLNGYSLNRGAGNEVILSYTNPEDETETAEVILPTGTTQDEILAEMHTITESLEIWAGGAA